MKFLEDDIVTNMAYSVKSTDLQVDKVRNQLYPEYEFTQPFGVWTGQIPIYAILPFYKKLIIHLDPYRDQRVFRRVYGVSIEEMVEFQRRGRLILLLRADYENYPKYYDVLLKEHIPLNNRFERVYLLKKGEEFYNYRDIIVQRFPDKSVSLPITLEKDIVKKVKTGHTRDFAINTMAHRLVKLSIVGLNERAIEVINNYTFLQAYKELHIYNRAIACPLIDALGGWDNLDEAHIELLKGISIKEKKGKQIVLPRDVLYWLNQQMGYSYPTTLSSGASYIDIVEQSYEVEKNHKILTAIHKAFLQSDFDACYNAAEKSRQLIADFEKHLVDIKRTQKSFRKWISRPFRYACLAISPLAFAMMENSMSMGNMKGSFSFGLLGVSSILLHEQIENIERLLVSLKHGTTVVPTMIWNRIEKR